jgi:hypothetical protein
VADAPMIYLKQGKKPRGFKKVLRFLGFLGFSGFKRLYTKTLLQCPFG